MNMLKPFVRTVSCCQKTSSFPEREHMHLELKTAINESASRTRLALNEQQLAKRQVQFLKDNDLADTSAMLGAQQELRQTTADVVRAEWHEASVRSEFSETVRKVDDKARMSLINYAKKAEFSLVG